MIHRVLNPCLKILIILNLVAKTQAHCTHNRSQCQFSGILRNVSIKYGLQNMLFVPFAVRRQHSCVYKLHHERLAESSICLENRIIEQLV